MGPSGWVVVTQHVGMPFFDVCRPLVPPPAVLGSQSSSSETSPVHDLLVSLAMGWAHPQKRPNHVSRRCVNPLLIGVLGRPTRPTKPWNGGNTGVQKAHLGSRRSLRPALVEVAEQTSPHGRANFLEARCKPSVVVKMMAQGLHHLHLSQARFNNHLSWVAPAHHEFSGIISEPQPPASLQKAFAVVQYCNRTLWGEASGKEIIEEGRQGVTVAWDLESEPFPPPPALSRYIQKRQSPSRTC